MAGDEFPDGYGHRFAGFKVFAEAVGIHLIDRFEDSEGIAFFVDDSVRECLFFFDPRLPDLGKVRTIREIGYLQLATDLGPFSELAARGIEPLADLAQVLFDQLRVVLAEIVFRHFSDELSFAENQSGTELYRITPMIEVVVVEFVEKALLERIDHLQPHGPNHVPSHGTSFLRNPFSLHQNAVFVNDNGFIREGI